MSAAQHLGAVAGAGVVAVSAAFWGWVSTPAIEVHSLVYEDGKILQDRTVNTDAPVFYAEWSAQIIEANTGAVVCSGSGSWNYEAGRGVYRLDLEDWVGAACDLAPGVTYRPVAAWHWGDKQTAHRGEPFTLDGQ